MNDASILLSRVLFNTPITGVIVEPRHPSEFIVNFRDVGETLERLSGEALFPAGMLYRGGRFTDARAHEELLEIPTILCLRPQKNARDFDALYLRAPMTDSGSTYDTTQKSTRAWLVKALKQITRAEVEAPIYVHCTSGKDRTGVLVAALLLVFGIEREWIVAEYLESDGDVDAHRIKQAIEGMGDIERYLRKVDLDALRAKFTPDVESGEERIN